MGTHYDALRAKCPCQYCQAVTANNNWTGEHKACVTPSAMQAYEAAAAENSNLRESLRLALEVVGELPHADNCTYVESVIDNNWRRFADVADQPEQPESPCSCPRSPDSPRMKRIAELSGELPAAAVSRPPGTRE